jgi:IS30 family transposase
MSEWMIRSADSRRGAPDWLARQEREDAVRWGVARSMSDRQIAQQLGLCDRTVLRIRRRLGLPNIYGKKVAA